MPDPLTTLERIPTVIVGDHDELGRLIACRIADLIRGRNGPGRRTVLGLATGSTPIGVYRELIRMYREEGLSFAFRHDGETETLVLLHFTAGLASLDAAPAEPRVVRTRAEAFEETVRSFTGSTRMRSAQVEVSMWDWKARPPTRIFGGQVPFDDDREKPQSAARASTSTSVRTSC